MASNDPIEIESGSGDPLGSVIWLHGLGADGHDFEPIVPELGLDPNLPLRFVFPHAPVRPVTINGGVAMRAWYDIVSFDRDGPVDATGIHDSVAILNALIDREQQRGVEATRIVAAGFSQGGAIAVHAALEYPEPLAGLLALSTYLPLPEVLAGDARQHKQLPIFMAHGQYDPVLPIELGRASATFLESAGYTVAWHDYPMAHGVCPQEIVDIGRWLASVFAHLD